MREPLDVDELRARVLTGAGLITALDVVAETTSTNADLLAAAAEGAPAGRVLVADFQTAGRGRYDREWLSPPRAGLIVSVLVRPPSHLRPRWGWLPLLTGLALRAAVLASLPGSAVPAGIGDDVRLKWPNDLLLGPDGAKAAGILVQATGDAAIIGVGVNVDHTAEELPTAQATSLSLVFGAAAPDRATLLVALLSELEARYSAWVSAAGDAAASGLVAEYEQVCDTLGRRVRVERPDGELVATARGIDADGGLVLESDKGTQTLSAGDVIHLRASER